MALNGGTPIAHTEATSFSVDCADQAEVDHLWDRLTENGGEPGPCGWLKDRYGMSWQIVPRRLPIFIAEGSFEKDYEVHCLPQMFIIDPRERIRFRLEDLLEANYFQESLDWMIEAARR